MNNDKVYQMDFSKIYPLLVNKAKKKGRTEAEVDEIICWLTGYTKEDLVSLAAGTVTGYQPEDIKLILEKQVSYAEFFRNAPELNANRHLIKGSICGIRVEEIEDPLMQEIRYLDKLIDELAKGKAMDKILRK